MLTPAELAFGLPASTSSRSPTPISRNWLPQTAQGRGLGQLHRPMLPGVLPLSYCISSVPTVTFHRGSPLPASLPTESRQEDQLQWGTHFSEVLLTHSGESLGQAGMALGQTLQVSLCDPEEDPATPLVEIGQAGYCQRCPCTFSCHTWVCQT